MESLIEKKARRSDDVAILQRNIGKYINFSDNSRFGMKYFGNQHGMNPLGIYGFLLTEELCGALVDHGADVDNEEDAGLQGEIKDYLKNMFHGFERKVLINIFEPLVDVSILEDTADLKKRVYNYMSSRFADIGEHKAKEIKINYMSKSVDARSFLRLCSNILFDEGQCSTLSVGTNIILRGAGFKAIRTDSGFFRDGFDHQLIILDPSACNLISTITNPYWKTEHRKQRLLEPKTEGLWEKKKREELEYEQEREKNRNRFKDMMKDKVATAYDKLLKLATNYNTFSYEFLDADNSNKEEDILDAIDHYSEGEKKLEDFNIIGASRKNLDEILSFEDCSGWLDFSRGELANKNINELVDTLNNFRKGYGFKVYDWLACGKIPPIVLVHGKEYNCIGDGRGRVNLAVGLDLETVPVIEIAEK